MDNVWPSEQWWKDRGYSIERDTGGNFWVRYFQDGVHITVSNENIEPPSSPETVWIAIYQNEDLQQGIEFNANARQGASPKMPTEKLFGNLLTSVEQSLIGLFGNNRDDVLRDCLFALETNLDFAKNHLDKDEGKQALQAVSRSLEKAKLLLT